MGKVKSVLFAFIMLMLLVGCGGESITGKYYEYNGDVKDESSWIELKGGKKWADDEGSSGRYEISDSKITFFGDFFGSEEELFDAEIDGGVITIDFLGTKTILKKDGASGSSSGNENEEEKKELSHITYIKDFTLDIENNEMSISVGADVDSLNMADYINIYEGYSWSVIELDTRNVIPNEYIDTTNANTDYAIRFIDLRTEEALFEVKIVIAKADAYTVTFYNEDQDEILSQARYAYGDRLVFPEYQVVGHNVIWQTESGHYIHEAQTLDRMGNMNVYAVINPKSYQVRLYYNDEYNSSQSYYAEFNKFNQFPDLRNISANREFKGWGFIDEGEVTFVTNEKGESLNKWEYTVNNLELNAIWDEHNLITINPAINNYNAGTVSLGFSTYSGEEVDVDINLNDYYQFLGWYVNDVLVSTDTNYHFTAPDEDLEIIARCVGIKQTVYLNADGLDKYVEVRYGEDYSLEVPYRAGYKFCGWKYNNMIITDEDGQSNGLHKINNATLVPAWDNNYVTYTVNNENAFGSIIVDGYTNTSGEKPVGEDITITASPNPGYEFDGWYQDNKLIYNKPSFVITIPDVDHLELTTKWKPKKYTVYFDGNGGDVVTASTEVDFLSSFTGEVPTRENFLFLGWFNKDTMYINENGDNVINYNYDGNLVLTAKWEADRFYVNVNGQANKGSVTGDGKHQYDSLVILQANPLPGYKFIGWYQDKELLSDKQYYQFIMTKADVNIETKWESREYNVELYDETTLINVIQINFGELKTFPILEDKPYYSFGGWYVGDTQYTDGLGAAILAYDIVENSQMQAKWIPNEFEVEVINDNELGEVIGAGSYGYQTEVVLKAKANAGWVFDGWYAGDVLLSKQSEYKFNLSTPENQTIITKWKIRTYLISLDKVWNEASINNLSVSVDYNQANFTLPTPTLPSSLSSRYRFVGWFYGNTAYTDAYGNSLGVWNNESITLTAKYSTILGVTHNFSVKKTSSSGSTAMGFGYYAETDRVVTVHVNSNYSINFGHTTANGGYMTSTSVGYTSYTLSLKKGDTFTVSISSNYLVNYEVTGTVRFE